LHDPKVGWWDVRLEAYPTPCDRSLSADCDLLDLDTGVDLSMAGPAAVVLALTELLNDQLRTFDRRNDLGRNRCRFERGPPDLQTVVIANGQDPIELQFLARWQIPEIDVEFLAFLDFVLVMAVFDDCVHRGLESFS
jgi:hypothetical protein